MLNRSGDSGHCCLVSKEVLLKHLMLHLSMNVYCFSVDTFYQVKEVDFFPNLLVKKMFVKLY